MNRFKVIAIAVVVLAFFGGSIYWLLQPTYVELFHGTRVQQTTAIERFLSTRQVAYRLDDAGKTVLVMEAQAPHLRKLLLENGVVTDVRPGLALFSGSDYGMTEFAQRINLMRAQQGELEKTILMLNEVAQVRVHLSDPHRQTVFGTAEKRRASVVLSFRPGHVASKQMVNGIQQLVSSSVDGISAADVAVLDSNGIDLSRGADIGTTTAFGEQSVSKQLENAATRLLHTLYPDGSIEVAVRVSYDTTSTSSTVETIPGNRAIIKSRRSKILSAGKKNPLRQENIEYISGRKVEKIAKPSGNIAKISVGVVVVAKDNEINDQTRDLLISALGLDIKHGDQLGLVFRPPLAVDRVGIKLPINPGSQGVGNHAVKTAKLAGYMTEVLLALLIVLTLMAVAAGLAWKRTRSKLRLLTAPELADSELLEIRQSLLTEIEAVARG